MPIALSCYWKHIRIVVWQEKPLMVKKVREQTTDWQYEAIESRRVVS
jgi:hypothetical protein